MPHEPVRNAAGEGRVSESDTCKMNYDNLKFPKQGKKKKEKNPNRGSILAKDRRKALSQGIKKADVTYAEVM